jgi:hypothetical protein
LPVLAKNFSFLRNLCSRHSESFVLRWRRKDIGNGSTGTSGQKIPQNKENYSMNWKETRHLLALS